MARTIRRKNYEAESGEGFNTWIYCDWVSSDDPGAGRAYGNFGRIQIDKQKEPKRWKQAWWKTHAESKGPNQYSPGSVYKARYERALKTLAKRELLKYQADAEYEVIIPDNPQDCWRDWY